MKLSPAKFRKQVKDCLKKETQRKVLWKSTASANKKRLNCKASIDDWENLSSQAHSVKKHVINNLDSYLEKFAKRASDNGINIFWAETGEEAVRYVMELALKKGITKAVKSKSMVTEELHLNDYLEKVGVNSVETDLGEYIAQIAGQMPSHIVGPVIHLSKEDVGKIYEDKLGIDYTDKAEELTIFTRKLLRKAFLEAELGISGVNFAMAEEGKFAVVENEGNARMSTGLPDVHVAMMGMEKLIPSMDYLPLFMKVLTASATGQKISNYLNIFGAPDGEGPSEIHVVIIDNGRSKVLADPQLRQALYCLRCGACLNTCPVYRRISGHGYGSVYPGPIGSVITPVFQGFEKTADLPFASSLCGMCSGECPVKIPLHHLLLKLRSDIEKAGLRPSMEKVCWEGWLFANNDDEIYKKAGNLLRLIQKAIPGDNLYAPGWSTTRNFPKAAEKTFRQIWNEEDE